MYTTTSCIIFLSNQWVKMYLQNRQSILAIWNLASVSWKRQPLCTTVAGNRFPALFPQANPGHSWWLAVLSNKTQCVGVHILRSGLIFFLHLKVCLKTLQSSVRDQRGRMGKEERLRKREWETAVPISSLFSKSSCAGCVSGGGRSSRHARPLQNPSVMPCLWFLATSLKSLQILTIPHSLFLSPPSIDFCCNEQILSAHTELAWVTNNATLPLTDSPSIPTHPLSQVHSLFIYLFF